jgi:hypothetical protein
MGYFAYYARGRGFESRLPRHSRFGSTGLE